jgi:hypothetical protein
VTCMMQAHEAKENTKSFFNQAGDEAQRQVCVDLTASSWTCAMCHWCRSVCVRRHLKHMAGWQEATVRRGSCESLQILCQTRPAFMQADRAEDKTRGFFGRASDETRRTADRAEDKTRGFFGRAADDTRRSADRAEDNTRG